MSEQCKYGLSLLSIKISEKARILFFDVQFLKKEKEPKRKKPNSK